MLNVRMGTQGAVTRPSGVAVMFVPISGHGVQCAYVTGGIDASISLHGKCVFWLWMGEVCLFFSG